MTGAAEIYIEGSPAERRAGHLDANGLALGLDIERVTSPRLIGAIFLARVKAVDKRLGAAFLDLGADQVIGGDAERIAARLFRAAVVRR